MVYRKLSLSFLFGLSVFLFAVSTWVDLSRYASDSTFVFKYISILFLFISTLFISKKEKSDFYSLLGLFLFLFFLCFYTIINLTGFQDLIILLGYVLLYIVYFFISKSKSSIQNHLKAALFYLGVLFVFLNIPLIFDPAAYSNIKAQFRGFFGNANAFTGLAGLFFILFFYLFNLPSVKYKKYLYLFFMVFLAFFLLLGFSRGTLLSTAIACFYLLFVMGSKRVLLISFLVLIVAFLFFVFKVNIVEIGVNRDLFEKTGRQLIFNNYFSELSERYFFVGTGVSIESGRIKSELAYLDVFLMTGFLGIAGLMFFILRTLYMSIYIVNKDSFWIVSVFIYIVFSSIFEGYIANILSLNSVLFYIVSALIYGCYKKERVVVKSL